GSNFEGNDGIWVSLLKKTNKEKINILFEFLKIAWEILGQNFCVHKAQACRRREGEVRFNRKEPYALDNLCDLARALAAWISQLLHLGRIHSHPACDRHCRADYQSDSRPASLVTLRQ